MRALVDAPHRRPAVRLLRRAARERAALNIALDSAFRASKAHVNDIDVDSALIVRACALRSCSRRRRWQRPARAPPTRAPRHFRRLRRRLLRVRLRHALATSIAPSRRSRRGTTSSTSTSRSSRRSSTAPRVRGRLARSSARRCSRTMRPSRESASSAAPMSRRYIQEATAGVQARRRRLGRRRHLLRTVRQRELDLARQLDLHALARRRLLAVLRAGVKATWTTAEVDRAASRRERLAEHLGDEQQQGARRAARLRGARRAHVLRSLRRQRAAGFAALRACALQRHRRRERHEQAAAARQARHRHAGAADGDGTGTWYGYAIVARDQVTPPVALAGRVEGYSDPDQVIVKTGRAVRRARRPARRSASTSRQCPLLWRTEDGSARSDPLFPDGPRTRGISKTMSRRLLARADVLRT